MWHHHINGFSNSKIWKTDKKTFTQEWKMIGLVVLSYSMDKIMKMFGGVFLYSNPLGSYEQSKFLGSSFITSEWIWIWKKPTVHLPYFIHRVRQNCQTNHFTFPDERFLSVFSNFWIWKTVDEMKSHDFCQRISWKITKENVWAKFYIPTGCGRHINKDC